MVELDKKSLTERDICTKLITPAIQRAGWLLHQFREEVKLTDGRVIVRGQIAARIKNPDTKGGPKRADYVLYAHPNVPQPLLRQSKIGFQLVTACSKLWPMRKCWMLRSRLARTGMDFYCMTGPDYPIP